MVNKKKSCWNKPTKYVLSMSNKKYRESLYNDILLLLDKYKQNIAFEDIYFSLRMATHKFNEDYNKVLKGGEKKL